MSTPLDDMKARFDSEHLEHIEYAESRNWEGLGFESGEDMMDNIEIFSEEESTCFESGWRQGYLDAIETVREWYRAEGYSV